LAEQSFFLVLIERLSTDLALTFLGGSAQKNFRIMFVRVGCTGCGWVGVGGLLNFFKFPPSDYALQI
jgi:hypothetical protein